MFKTILLATLFILTTSSSETEVVVTRNEMTFDGYLKDLVVEEDDEPDEQIESDWFTPCSTSSTFKSYMDYRAITNTSSKQYTLQQQAYTENGYRMVDGRMMIAMANVTVGTKYDIQLSSGEILNVVIGDVKAGTMCLHGDSSMVEFIVDTHTMDSYVRQMGNYDVVHTGTVERMREVE